MRSSWIKVKVAGAVVAVLVGGLALAGGLQAFEHRPMRGKAGGGPPQHVHPPHPGHLLAKALHDASVLEALVELTGEDVNNLRAALKCPEVGRVVASYGIDRDVFRSALEGKLKDQVTKLVQCGLIAQEQGEEILERMEDRGAKDRPCRPCPDEE